MAPGAGSQSGSAHGPQGRRQRQGGAVRHALAGLGHGGLAAVQLDSLRGDDPSLVLALALLRLMTMMIMISIMVIAVIVVVIVVIIVSSSIGIGIGIPLPLPLPFSSKVNISASSSGLLPSWFPRSAVVHLRRGLQREGTAGADDDKAPVVHRHKQAEGSWELGAAHTHRHGLPWLHDFVQIVRVFPCLYPDPDTDQDPDPASPSYNYSHAIPCVYCYSACAVIGTGVHARGCVYASKCIHTSVSGTARSRVHVSVRHLLSSTICENPLPVSTGSVTEVIAF